MFKKTLIAILILLILVGCTKTDQPKMLPEPVIENIQQETSEPQNTQPMKESVDLSFSWQKDQGQRTQDGSVPYIHRTSSGSRLYYCNDKGISSSNSKDDLTFTKDQGTRLSPGTGFEKFVCDPTVIDLPNGKIRMYYKGADSNNPGPGNSIHKIFSAISSDGLTFQREGLRIDSQTNGDNGWASVPDAIILPDGRIRLYYVTAAQMEHGIGSAISTDGLNFEKEQGLRVPNLVDPSVIMIGDKYIMFAASIDERFGQVPKGIYYLQSDDGINFDNPKPVFQGDNVYDPSALKIDEKTVRVFYGKVLQPNPPAVESHTGKLE